MKFFRGILLNGHPGGFVFFDVGCQKRVHGRGYDLNKNYGMVVILLSFPCSYDNLTLKLHQEKRSYPAERRLFNGGFKVGSVPGMCVALEVSKKVSKSIMSMMHGH